MVVIIVTISHKLYVIVILVLHLEVLISITFSNKLVTH